MPRLAHHLSADLYTHSLTQRDIFAGVWSTVIPFGAQLYSLELLGLFLASLLSLSLMKNIKKLGFFSLVFLHFFSTLETAFFSYSNQEYKLPPS